MLEEKTYIIHFEFVNGGHKLSITTKAFDAEMAFRVAHSVTIHEKIFVIGIKEVGGE